MISMHPRIYETLLPQYPELAELVVPELEVSTRAAWHAGGTPRSWLEQFSPGALDWMHTDFIGMDHLPDLGSTRVTNGRGTTESFVSEWVLAATLAASKRFGSYRKWSDRRSQAPILLRDARITIVGRGTIGTLALDQLRSCGAANVTLTGAEDLAPARLADIVVLTTSRRAETVGLIDSSEFALWQRGSWIVSITHGGVIVEQDLAEHLRNGHFGGAILDCFEEEPLTSDSPLWQLATVSPHLAWYTPESTSRRVELFASLALEWYGTRETAVDSRPS